MKQRRNRAMTKDDYVSLEVAKKLKEKGYPQEYNVGTICRLQNKANPYYEKTREITESDINNAWCVFNEVYPTLYEAQKWLRKKHNVYVNSLPSESVFGIKNKFTFTIDKLDSKGEWECGWEQEHDNFYTNYEEAFNSGILESLNYI